MDTTTTPVQDETCPLDGAAQAVQDESGTQPAKEDPHPLRGGLLGHMSRLTARLYAALSDSVVGRVATGYRRVNAATAGRHGREGGKPISHARLVVAETVKNSRITALLEGILRTLYDMPLRFYGVFALAYGMMGILIYFFIPYIYPSLSPEQTYFMVAGVMLLISIPLLISRSTLHTSLLRSRLVSRLLTRYLCMPDDDTLVTERRGAPAMLLIMGAIFGVGATVGTLFVSPLLLPHALLVLAFGGMIFSYPESGVLITTAALPVAWLLPAALYPMVALILLTWLSYGLQLLQLRRTWKSDVLDVVGLVMMILALISGVGGILTGNGSVRSSVLLVCSLSVYFLLVHLMNTREYVRNCLVGVGATVICMLVAGLLSFVNSDEFGWLPGAYGGQLAKDIFDGAVTLASDADRLCRDLAAIMTLPCLCAFFLRARRLFVRFVTVLLCGVNLYLMGTISSMSTVVCAASVTLIFCLLMDHRTLVAGALLLPGGVGAAGWFIARYGPVSTRKLDAHSYERLILDTRMEESWQLVTQYPLGMGIGVASEKVNFYMEVLLSMGWQGMAIMVVFVLLLLQKSMTALSYTRSRSDRALVVGLLTAAVGFFFYGANHAFLSEPRAMLALTILCALLSVYGNILFAERDRRRAEMAYAEGGVDRFYHRL